MKLEPGDLVVVEDSRLEVFRMFRPDRPPNHQGRVLKVLEGGRVIVEFPTRDSPILVSYSIGQVKKIQIED